METLTKKEVAIYDQEKDFPFRKLNYEEFYPKVQEKEKNGLVSEEDFKEISKDIKIKYDKMLESQDSHVYQVLRDSSFIYMGEQGYKAQELLLLGFLFCDFEKENEHL